MINTYIGEKYCPTAPTNTLQPAVNVVLDHLKIIYWPHSFTWVFMSSEHYTHSIIVEQCLKAVEYKKLRIEYNSAKRRIFMFIIREHKLMKLTWSLTPVWSLTYWHHSQYDLNKMDNDQMLWSMDVCPGY